MRHFTISSIKLMLEGSGCTLRSSGINWSRRYWLEGPDGAAIPESRSATLDGIRAFIEAANLAA